MACGAETPDPCDTTRQASGTVCLEQVLGTVVDENGAPMPDLPVTVCGPICFQGTTDRVGSFVVEVQEYVLASEYSVQPHGTPTGTTFYYPMPVDFEGGSYQAGTLRVLPLPSGGDSLVSKTDLELEEIPPAQSVTSGPLELRVAEGTSVRLSISDVLGGSEGRAFRASELTAEFVSEFAPELKGSRVFALGPFETEFSAADDAAPEVSLSLENTLDWEAGSEVTVLGLGTYLDPEWIAPAEFGELGVASVSADGGRVELAVDKQSPGLRHLTWIAFSLR